MATTHGHLSEFCQDKEEWPSYCERLEQYFLANDVTSEEKQRGILMRVCSPSTYQLICILLSPEKPSSETLFCGAGTAGEGPLSTTTISYISALPFQYPLPERRRVNGNVRSGTKEVGRTL